MSKNILIIGLLAVCLWLFFFYKAPTVTTEATVVNEAKVLADTEVKRVVKKIDEKGFEHAVIEEVENVVRSRSGLSDSVKMEIDSITRLLGIRDRQLKQWISYSATLKDSLMAAVNTDTSYRYTDEWAEIEFITPTDTTNQGHFNFSYNAEINYSEYWQRSWFLAPKRHYIDFWISDPRATIGGVRRVKFEPREPARVEVNAIGVYDGSPSIGVDGQIRFGRMSIGAGYVYDMRTKDWRPIVSGRYRLIDF